MSSPWVERSEVEEVWAEAETLDDGTLNLYLAAAQEQCETYLPQGTVSPVPAGWRLALIMQTRALWNGAQADGGDTIGPEGFVVRVYPMDRNVKSLLRPKRAVPVMF